MLNYEQFYNWCNNKYKRRIFNWSGILQWSQYEDPGR